MSNWGADLRIRNVDIVSAEGIRHGDICVRDGKIIPDCSNPKEEIDGTGLTAFPGLLDTHMHVRAPGISHRETFYTGTAAAAAGGVTTIFEMPVSRPATSNVELLKERIAEMEQKAVVDTAFYGAAGFDNVEDIIPLADYGVIGFKTFSQRAVKGRENEFHGLCCRDSGDLYKVCAEVAKTGKLIAIHAESDPLIDLIMEDPEFAWMKEGPYYARPKIVELDAIARAIVIGRDTGCRISLCHCSSVDAVELAMRMRDGKQECYIETCLHYMECSQDDTMRIGPCGKRKPPLREAEGLPVMRRHFANGDIDMLGSDHAPFTAEEKQKVPSPDGIACVEMTLPMLLLGYKRGEFRLEDIANYASKRPCTIFGLDDRKGSLEAGKDADIVLVDLNKTYKVELDKLQTMAKACAKLYEGRETGGTVVRTIVRGKTVYLNGEITAEPGWGTWIRPKQP